MRSTLAIDLPLLLPDVPDERDACVDRLLERLESANGVEAARVQPAAGGAPPRVCIDYDPRILSMSRIRALTERTGARITDHFGHLLWELREVTHPRRARAVAERLRQTRGVIEAEVSPAGPLRIEYDRRATDEAALRRLLRRLDAPAKPIEQERRDEHAHDHDHDAHGGLFGGRAELVFACLAGATLLGGWLLGFTDVHPWTSRAFYMAAYVFGGFHPARFMLQSLRAGRFDIDLLMIVAAAGAAALDRWAEGALLLFLFSLGHALEHYAMGRARRAIEALARLAPDRAIVRRGGAEQEIPVEQLAVGDIVIVRPNERLPADGVVARGTSSVNQAPVTGESVPADKQAADDVQALLADPESAPPQHRVYTGTINGEGTLEIAVTRRAEDSTLARIIRLVTEAETQKSPTQRFADRFERWFVPSVLSLVAVLHLAFLVVDEPFAASFYRAMAVLVGASPCALAIATPSAVLSGVARAGRGGVLVKGGGPLEHLGTLSAIAFDKTGTLTEGRPRVVDVAPADGATEQELLEVAVAVERLSEHPLAAAVVRDGTVRLNGRAPLQARDLRSTTGRGVQASIDGEVVVIGKAVMFEELDGPRVPDALRQAVHDLEHQGRTTMVVRSGERYLGALGLMDVPRANAAAVIERLRELGIRRMIMISGDNQRVVEAVAQQIGIDEARGDLMPEDKVAAIRGLRGETAVAMVGDGVNDAPAMAAATVGVAMGAAGSEVALETAEIALMADDLSRLPFAVGLSRSTSRIIRQNVWISLGMVAFLIPAAILGLPLGPAVALHEGSTVVVVLNALRLLRYREGKQKVERRK